MISALRYNNFKKSKLRYSSGAKFYSVNYVAKIYTTVKVDSA